MCVAVQTKRPAGKDSNTSSLIFAEKEYVFSSVTSIFLSQSHLFLYRPNAEESDVLISKDRYIHLHEEYSDDNKLSSASWLTYSDSDSIQQNRTQRISHRLRYIIMREIQYICGYIG